MNIVRKKKIRKLKSKKIHKWAKYTRGLGKEIWNNIDIDQYIRELRSY